MSITALPTPPSRSDPDNFATAADAFHNALPTFATEANNLQADVNAKQAIASAAAVDATASATTAQQARDAAQAAANYRGLWSSLTGALAIPASVYHNSNFWMLTSSLADVTASQPGIGSEWVAASGFRGPLPTIRPSLLLAFAAGKTVDPRITSGRTTTATYIDATGARQTAAIGEARISHDPVTGECLGLMLEEARTNLLLNSDTLSTQTVTVTAVAHTLQFSGTGTITLSGAATGALVGAGDFPTINTMTFTPSAGSLTLTVTGTVRFGDLEAGGNASSYIPTVGSTVTRAADIPTMLVSSFPYNQAEGTIVATVAPMSVSLLGRTVSLNDGTTNNRIGMAVNTNATVSATVTAGGATQASPAGAAVSANVKHRTAFAYKLNDFALVLNGVLSATDTSGTVPTVTRLDIGNQIGVGVFNGYISSIRIYPRRLTNAEMQALTAP